MNSVDIAPQTRFPAVGEESFEAVRKAIREAIIDHGQSGRPIVVSRDGKIIEVNPDENGRYVDPA